VVNIAKYFSVPKVANYEKFAWKSCVWVCGWTEEWQCQSKAGWVIVTLAFV